MFDSQDQVLKSPKKNRLTVLSANVQSIMAKKDSLWSTLKSAKPDIFLACESWPKPEIYDSYVIPPDLDYENFRKDRKDGHGGVLIAVGRNLIYELVPTDDTCQLIAVKITCQHNSVIAAPIYRPTNNDTEYAAHLATAKENLEKKHTKDVIWIGGDSNLPDIDWSTNSITGCNYKRDINEAVLQAADNCNLDQVVDFPTRDANLLHVFLTNRNAIHYQASVTMRWYI